MPMSDARREFAELVNQAHYAGQITVVTKHGRDVAAIVPATNLPGGSEGDGKKRANPVPRSRSRAETA
jgi:prevent-host-death family protein